MRFEFEVKKENGNWVVHVTDTKSGLPCFSSWAMPGEHPADFMPRAEAQWNEAREAMLKWENR